MTTASTFIPSSAEKRDAIVYVILCHKSPQFIRELMLYLYNDIDFYIFHVDKKADEELHSFIEQLSDTLDNVHKLNSLLVSWGGYSVVAATMAAMGYACKYITGWSHFIPISGEHLPLQNSDYIASQLQRTVSYIDARPLDLNVDSARNEDLFHRFASVYFEFPGVGCFSTSRRSQDSLLRIFLHAGSQWIAVSRECCMRLSNSKIAVRLLDYFSSTLFSDETAIQTAILGLGIAEDLKYERKNLTFVAISGRDMLFTEENFFAARSSGFLYIRKRPKVLPLLVGNVLKSFVQPILPKILLEEKADGTLVKKVDIEANALVNSLKYALEAADKSVKIIDYNLKEVLRPRFYIQIKCEEMDERLFVAVLSDNLVNFKVAIVLKDSQFGKYSEKQFGPYISTVLKVRVHGIAYNREIHVLKDASGFIDVNDSDLSALINLIMSYLKTAVSLNPYLAEGNYEET